MNFKQWRKQVLADLEKTSYRAVALKYGLSTTSLQNFKKLADSGDEFAGMTTWKHWFKAQKNVVENV